MAWAQSKKDIDDLEDLARQRSREAAAREELNESENRLAIATDENNIRADHLQLKRDAEHQRNMAARHRRLESHSLTAVSDPGRYSPQAVKAARDYLENTGHGARRYEFDEAQNTARHVASEKARGMIGQGSDAARARAEGDKNVAEINAANALKQKELETAAQKELGALEAQTRNRAIDAEHGVRNADGTLSEGSRERVERIKGEASVATQREASMGEAARAEAARQQKREEWEARARIQLGKNAAQYDSAQIKAMSGIIIKAYENTLTPEDRAKETARLKEQYKNNPLALALIDTAEGNANPPPANNNGAANQQGGDIPKEGERGKDKDGRPVVFRNGKWDYVD